MQSKLDQIRQDDILYNHAQAVQNQYQLNMDLFTGPPSYSSLNSVNYFSRPNNFGSATEEGFSASRGAGSMFSSTASMSSGLAGMGISALDTGVTNYLNATSINAAKMGNGPEGHAFDAVSHAENQASFNTLNSNIRSAMFTVGSAFGPEGIAAAAVGSLVEGAIASNFSPSVNTNNSTNGNQVSAASAI